MRTDAVQKILRRGDIRLVLLVPENKLEYYRKEFPDTRILFDVIPTIRNLKIEKLFNFIERFSIHTRTVYMIFRSEYEKTKNLSWFRRIGTFTAKFLLWWVGQFSWWRRVVRAVYYAIPSTAGGYFFKKYNPDMVFCPYMIFTDYVFLKEAKKAGIATLGMTQSWDNLYSKTFLLVHPDYLVVQTDKIKDQARGMGDYRGDLWVCGIPQYDRHFTKQDTVSREEFFKKIGADPAKKLLVYAFSGKQGLHLDFDVLNIINEARKHGEFLEEVEILARPYPRTDFPQEKLERIRRDYGIISFSATKHVGGGDADWEFDEESIWMLENTLAHADVVITMYSTFFIEAAIFNKPLIGVAFDGLKKMPYWDSASRFFEWDHLRDIRPLDGIWLVENAKELIHAINTYLKNPGYQGVGREKIVRQQAQFTDGRSAQRVADVILQIL